MLLMTRLSLLIIMWHLCIKYMLNSLLGGHCQIDTRLHPLHHHTDLDTTSYWNILYSRMKNIAWCQQIMRCKNSKLIDAFLTIIVYCHEIKTKIKVSFLSTLAGLGLFKVFYVSFWEYGLTVCQPQTGTSFPLTLATVRLD